MALSDVSKHLQGQVGQQFHYEVAISGADVTRAQLERIADTADLTTGEVACVLYSAGFKSGDRSRVGRTPVKRAKFFLFVISSHRGEDLEGLIYRTADAAEKINDWLPTVDWGDTGAYKVLPGDVECVNLTAAKDEGLGYAIWVVRWEQNINKVNCNGS